MHDAQMARHERILSLLRGGRDAQRNMAARNRKNVGHEGAGLYPIFSQNINLHDMAFIGVKDVGLLLAPKVQPPPLAQRANCHARFHDMMYLIMRPSTSCTYPPRR